MTKRMKVKVVIEWRKGKPAIFANVNALVKRKANGLYRVMANDHKGSLYYANADTWNPAYRCFEDKG